jgi:internalin A
MNSPKWAVDRIQEAKNKNSFELDLSCPINAPNNQKLQSIPEDVLSLHNLTRLKLSNNKLSEIPYSISNLIYLQTLDVSKNEFFNFPSEILKLFKLEDLNLSFNKLESIPKTINHLAELRNLDLSWNNLKAIPPEIANLKKLEILKLERNSLTTPPLDIIERGLEAIKDYFSASTEYDYLYEAKLLLLGEGGSGKSALAKAIIEQQYQLENERTTEGIDIIPWKFPFDEGNEFRVNIWEFGGQEIYHATHQFFLTKRSLYVLVADTRKEDTDFYYWLNLIQLLSENCPLIIVKNEKQDRFREINERQLMSEFENIKEILSVNVASRRGIENLKTVIKNHITTLPHIGSPLPKNWINIREHLERSQKKYIQLKEYIEICEENGFTAHGSFLLSGFLHDIGVILHFADNQILNNFMILKPKWATDAIYKVLDNKEIIRSYGSFDREDLARIWNDPEYDNMHNVLLEIMLRFQLCYRVKDEKKELFIAPQLLTENQPEYVWNEKENLKILYKYEFLPKGILIQFIAAIAQYNVKRIHNWKSGTVLMKNDAYAEVIEYYGRRTIQVRTSGKNTQQLLAIVTGELDKINSSYKRLKYEKLIPCLCSECKNNDKPYLYRFDDLTKRLERGYYLLQCPDSFNEIDIKDLLAPYISSSLLDTTKIEIAEHTVLKGEARIDDLSRHQEAKNIVSEISEKRQETKLLIVGEPGAGKTSLMKKLIEPAYIIPSKEDPTLGLNIRKWAFASSVDRSSKFITNIWDFGGQEIQYMIHHFFLTSKALYILVCDDREQKTEFDYWFRIIGLMGEDSPVLVVLNEKGSKSATNFDFLSYKNRYSSLKIEKREVDLAVNDGRLDELRSKIQSMIFDLGPIDTPSSVKWTKARESLEDHRQKNNYISIEEYFRICDQNDIFTEQEKLSLSKYLHHIGDILHFQDDSNLYNILILNPKWAIDGTYAVLANRELEVLGGRFTKQKIFTILEEKGYSFQDRNSLLNLMKKDVFELCYHLPGDILIAPQLLPKTKPEYYWIKDDNLQFQFQYPFMPKGILQRLIVRLNGYVQTDKNGKDLVWAKGGLFVKGKAIAEVIEDISPKGIQSISIRVRSLDPSLKTTPDKKALLTVIREEILNIHKSSFDQIKFDQMIPCICFACQKSNDPHLFSNEFLDRRIELRQKAQCQNSGDMVDTIKLIDDVIGFEKYIDEQNQQGKPVNIYHIYEGDKNVTNNKITINNSQLENLIVDSDIRDSFNKIDSANIEDKLKETLKQLAQAVDQMNKELPKDIAEETKDYLEKLIEESTKKKPNPKWYNVSIEGLTKAAENLGKVGKPVMELAAKVLFLLK